MKRGVQSLVVVLMHGGTTNIHLACGLGCETSCDVAHSLLRGCCTFTAASGNEYQTKSEPDESEASKCSTLTL